MATVDVHPSAGVSGPVGSALKLWERRAGGATSGGAPSYALSTHISEPHRCARSWLLEFRTPVLAHPTSCTCCLEAKKAGGHMKLGCDR